MKVINVIESYIKFRESLGYKDSITRNSTFQTYHKFAAFVGNDKEFDIITEDDCLAFLNGNGTEVTTFWKKKHSALKKLFEWACSRGYAHEVAIPKFIPKMPDTHPAYIYSNEELKALFSASLNYMKGESITDPKSIRYILLVTYVMGLRVSETINLKFKHIDVTQQIIHIEESKFYKSRYVTYNHQVARLINEIIEWCRLGGFTMGPEDYLFVSKIGEPVNFVTLHCIFAKIRKKANLYYPELKRHQPRIHDLRHTFAVNVLTSWYKQGKDVQTLLPKLSTYLGHQSISHTSVYLTKTIQILEEANKLFYNYKTDNNEIITDR